MLFGYHNPLELWFSLIIFLHDFIYDAPFFLMYLRFVTTLKWKAVDRAQSPGDLGLSQIPLMTLEVRLLPLLYNE